MSFNRILIPVDFTVNTEVAIRKGIELSYGPSPSIHLLHVAEAIATSPFAYFRYLTSYPLKVDAKKDLELTTRLEQWAEFIKRIRPDISVCHWTAYKRSVEKTIAEKGKKIGADLIVIGKNSRHSLLPFLNSVFPCRIAFNTGIPVLTVKPGSLTGTLKTVVVPFGLDPPIKKLAIIKSLGDKFSIQLRLLILVGKHDDLNRIQVSLLNVYQQLKNRFSHNISYEFLRARNKGWDILNYCEKVSAELLIVNTESETRIGWPNKHIPDELSVNSKTQILAVGQSNLSII